MTSQRRAALALALLALAVPSAGAQRMPELRVEGGIAYITQRGFSLENAALLADYGGVAAILRFKI